MAREVVGLVLANVGYLLVGAAALVVVGWLTADRASWFRLGAAYPLGIVVVVLPASYVALFGVPVAVTAIVVGALVVVAAIVCVRRRRGGRVGRGRLPRPSPAGGVAVAFFLVLAVLLAYAARTFAVRPDIEWDSWAVWLAKARLLYSDPSAAPAALRSGELRPDAVPAGLPTLEALGFKAMGRYDSTAIGLQFLLLACAFPLSLWSLLRARARPWVIALVALAIIGAPQILYQLLTRYADVPLGLFIGLGIAAGAAWLVGRPGDTWLLGCFAAFLAMAGILKSEGFLFALAGLCRADDRRSLHLGTVRWRCPGAKAIGAVLALIVPWQLYCAAYGLSTPDYNLVNAANPSYLGAHADRVRPAARELWENFGKTGSWGLLVWVILLALAVASSRPDRPLLRS